MFLKGNAHLFWSKKRNWNRKVSRRSIFSFHFHMKVSLMIKKFPLVYEAERSGGDFSDYFPTVDTVDYPVRDSHFQLTLRLLHRS